MINLFNKIIRFSYMTNRGSLFSVGELFKKVKIGKRLIFMYSSVY